MTTQSKTDHARSSLVRRNLTKRHACSEENEPSVQFAVSNPWSLDLRESSVRYAAGLVSWDVLPWHWLFSDGYRDDRILFRMRVDRRM